MKIIILLILAFASVANCEDTGISGADLGGLYDDNFLRGDGDFEIKEKGDAYKIRPLLAPPLDLKYEDFSTPPHFHGSGHHPYHPRPHVLARPPIDYGYGQFRRPVLYDDIETWRPIIQPVVPVAKKVVPKPFHYPIYKPPVVSATIVKSVEDPHLGVYGNPYVGQNHGPVGGIGHTDQVHPGGGHHHADPHHPIYKPVIPLYKATPFSIEPSLSYGYSYKLVPTYAYGPAILDEHSRGYGHAQAHS